MATNNNPIPGRRMVVDQKVAGSISQAVSVDGSKGAITTDVFNSVSAEKEIVINMKNNNVAARPNIKLFLGSWEDDYVLPGDSAFTVKNFASYAAFQRFFRTVSTAVSKITMQTDDVTNYDGELIITYKDPSGKETEVPIYLSKYKVSLGAGWSPKLEVPIKYMPNATVSLRLSNLAATSEITMYMTIGGVNKVTQLSPIAADII